MIVSEGPDSESAPPIERTLRVRPNATLQSLSPPSHSETWVPPSNEAVLYVYGHYSDGVERADRRNPARTRPTRRVLRQS